MFGWHLLGRVINQLIIPSLCQSRALLSVYHMPPCIAGWLSSQGRSHVRKQDLGSWQRHSHVGQAPALGLRTQLGITPFTLEYL